MDPWSDKQDHGVGELLLFVYLNIRDETKNPFLQNLL